MFSFIIDDMKVCTFMSLSFPNYLCFLVFDIYFWKNVYSRYSCSCSKDSNCATSFQIVSSFGTTIQCSFCELLQVILILCPNTFSWTRSKKIYHTSGVLDSNLGISTATKVDISESCVSVFLLRHVKYIYYSAYGYMHVIHITIFLYAFHLI